MNEWCEAELKALRTRWPELEYNASGHWVLIRNFKIPAGWSKDEINLAVRIPENLPGQEPYGFWVQGGIALSSGQVVTNYVFPSETLPFTNDNQWGQFSWAFEAWAPGSEHGAGTGMIHFVQSVTRRFEELN